MNEKDREMLQRAPPARQGRASSQALGRRHQPAAAGPGLVLARRQVRFQLRSLPQILKPQKNS